MRGGDPRAVTDIFATVLGTHRDIVIVLHVVKDCFSPIHGKSPQTTSRKSWDLLGFMSFYESRFSTDIPVKTIYGMLEGESMRECNKIYKN